MKALSNLRAIMCVVLLAFAVGCSSSDADLILTNANIYTLSWSEPDLEGNPAEDAPYENGKWTPDASAVALKDGIIVAIGSETDVEAFRGTNTEVIDLEGAYVVPGLIESHGHYDELGPRILGRAWRTDARWPARA